MKKYLVKHGNQIVGAYNTLDEAQEVVDSKYMEKDYNDIYNYYVEVK